MSRFLQAVKVCALLDLALLVAWFITLAINPTVAAHIAFVSLAGWLMAIYQTAIPAGIAKLEGSICNNFGVVKSVEVLILRITGGVGTLLAPVCRDCKRRYRERGLSGVPAIEQEVTGIWAEHTPTSRVIQ